MIIQIGAGGPPPYEQIRSQVLVAIENGGLRPGDRLPTVRELAANPGLAPNTVARAHSELEQAGAIITRGRRGSFVAPQDADDHLPVTAHAAAQAYIAELVRLDLDLADAVGLVQRHWK